MHNKHSNELLCFKIEMWNHEWIELLQVNAWDRKKTSSYSHFRSCKRYLQFSVTFFLECFSLSFPVFDAFRHRKQFQIQDEERVKFWEFFVIFNCKLEARVVKNHEHLRTKLDNVGVKVRCVGQEYFRKVLKNLFIHFLCRTLISYSFLKC